MSRYWRAPRQDVIEVRAGQAAADPYRLLERDDSLATSEWLAGQRQAYDAWLAGRLDRGRWLRRLMGVTGHGWASVPPRVLVGSCSAGADRAIPFEVGRRYSGRNM